MNYMPFKLKKGWIIVISTLLIFILLNPTYSDFKDFTGLHGQEYETVLHRQWNFLVLSVYKIDDTGENRTYLAILKNFIQIS